MAGFHFPQEIQDMVIDNLSYDDLLSGCLVSRSWCRQSRKILFNSVQVPAPFIGSVFQSFINKNKIYAHCVRKVTLYGVWPEDWDENDQDDQDGEDDQDVEDVEDGREQLLPVDIRPEDIAKILSTFCNLETLVIRDVSIVSTSPLSICNETPFSLRNLVLSHIVTADTTSAEDAVLEILGLVPSVQNLELVDFPNRLTSLDDKPENVVNEDIRIRASQCKILDVKSSGVFLEILRRGCSVSRPLTRLEIGTEATSGLISLGRFLQSAGHQLQYLGLDVSKSIRNMDPGTMDPYMTPEIVDRSLAAGLAACSNLHACTLGIWLPVSKGDWLMENSRGCLAQLISSLPASVRELTLEIHGRDRHIFDDPLNPDRDEVNRITTPLKTWRHLHTLKKFKLHFLPRITWSWRRVYMEAVYDYRTHQEFKNLDWSAEFDVEITAMTWDWRYDEDGTGQVVEVPFDNWLPPNLPREKWRRPHFDEDIDCIDTDLERYVGSPMYGGDWWCLWGWPPRTSI